MNDRILSCKNGGCLTPKECCDRGAGLSQNCIIREKVAGTVNQWITDVIPRNAPNS